MDPQDIQRQHYIQTADSYDLDLGSTPEHEFALYLLLGFIDSVRAESVLDVGAGTGRGLKFLMQHRPNLAVTGIEPVEELRRVGVNNGVPSSCLIEGDGSALPFPDASFDVVTELACYIMPESLS